MPIHYQQNRKLWILLTQHTGYAFGLHESGHIKHTYWGNQLQRIEDYPDLSFYRDRVWWDWNDEFPVRGEGNMAENCLKVLYHDGTRDVVLTYDQAECVCEDHLVVTLLDKAYSLEVKVHYHVIAECDIIDRWVEIRNLSQHPIRLEEMGSASWYIPPYPGLQLTHLTGLWAHETCKIVEPVKEGKKVLESRLGHTSAFHNPFFAISLEAAAESGKIWYGALGWSGNWKITVQKMMYETVQVSGGINDWDNSYLLEPNETFVTPVFTGGFTNKGFGQMSRNLHRYQLEHILPADKRNSPRKVLYNSWEATNFGVNEENQKRLADLAAQIGVELFVMDDGWFGGRNHDRAGLGDWWVNRTKFPNGLKPLIDHVKSKGMDFGLWIEPEMVNPDSDLYRAHPDWVLQFPNRPQTLRRNQLILNVARKEVHDFILDTVDLLLTENDISFIKWDMNRPVLESGWQDAVAGKAQEMWVRYVQNLYSIWRTLRDKHPRVTFESCSGGGGRVDFGILKYADQVWTSDNTDPFDRQFIQEGFSLVYAPKVMMNWVTDWGGKNAYPLSFRYHTAMMGSMGIGADLSHFTPEEMEESKKLIHLYKEIRDIVQHGELYRIRIPSRDASGEGHYTVNQFITRDKKQIVVIVLKNPAALTMFDTPLIALRGLPENTLYRLRATAQVLSSSVLQEIGIPIVFDRKFDFKLLEPTHFQSQVLILDKVEE